MNKSESSQVATQVITRSLVFKIILVTIAVVWLGVVAASWADADERNMDRSSERVDRSDDEYNFNWLDPEKKIYVLQNRRYRKAGSFVLSVMGGPGFSNAYRTTYNLDPRAAYYLTDAWGIEAFFTLTTNLENTTYLALRQASPNIFPPVREIRSQYGGLIHWVPWYAKINVFNKILYFDWYFSGGAGMIHTSVDQRTNVAASPSYLNENLFAFYLGTGHQYHLGDHFLVRLDLTSAIYRAPIPINNSLVGDSAWYSNYNFGLGLGLKL
ncbi:outer membrane beta-barrel domain-containing protein [Bdellovibrionota bacterium FG-1]